MTDARRDQRVIALMKGVERYVFRYGPGEEQAIIQTIGRFAGNQELSLTWYDAAYLSQRIRKMEKEAKHG